MQNQEAHAPRYRVLLSLLRRTAEIIFLIILAHYVWAFAVVPLEPLANGTGIPLLEMIRAGLVTAIGASLYAGCTLPRSVHY